MKSILLLLYLTIFTLVCCGQKEPSQREMEMIDEINYARSEPLEYSKFIKDYLDYWNYNKSEKETAKELINVLHRMEPLDSLLYSNDLYQQARKHGKWMLKNDRFDHSKYRNAENLVAGDSLVRFAVISLLIDDGVPSRGHRWNLLSKSAKYVACHELNGTVGGDDFVFIQEFD